MHFFCLKVQKSEKCKKKCPFLGGHSVFIYSSVHPFIPWGIHGNVLRNAWGPYELIRADIYQASDFDDPVVTETEDGAFYVFKAENSDFYPLSNIAKGGGLVVTMTSDGLVVTAAENKDFTVVVHNNGGTPTAVENVQTNQVQAIKFFRDGQLLIEKNGKIYNVQGVEVR